MSIQKRSSLLLSLMVFLSFFLFKTATGKDIGAQVWIEPGQTKAEIENWFAILADHNMKSARLFMMWNYLQVSEDEWDFTLYDWAFDAAKKNGIKIQATLSPEHGPAFVNQRFYYKEQHGPIAAEWSHLEASQEYIKRVVERYKKHKGLGNWWLMNEPGQLNRQDSIAIERFQAWLQEKYLSIDSLNHTWLSAFSSFESISYHSSWDGAGGFTNPSAYLDWNWFWRDHLTWYMQFIADEIRKHDAETPLHVNPHGIFEILHKYDLPAWRQIVNSLGASIHPSWHLGYFERNDYAIGVSAICDIIRGSSAGNPFWVSELQGGNNIWSGTNPLCPTESDIEQWVWTGIGNGAEQVIFWCLNWRRQGGEAGEWSMLDFQNNPSERLETVSGIAETLEKNKQIFKDTKPVEDKVTLLVSPETMLILWRKDLWKDIDGRGKDAHMKSLLAFYKTLLQMGIPVGIQQFDDYSWDSNQTGKTVILPNSVALDPALAGKVKRFVENGNQLIATGLTGFFDPREINMHQTLNPYEEVFGAKVKEVKITDNPFLIDLKELGTVPFHFWYSTLLPTTAKPLALYEREVIATSNQLGKGNVLFIPAMIGLEAWLHENDGLKKLLSQYIATENHLFTMSTQNNIIAKTLQSPKGYIVLITNSADVPGHAIIRWQGAPDIEAIYNSKGSRIEGEGLIKLNNRGTIVLHVK
jgi:beta-galactosidase